MHVPRFTARRLIAAGGAAALLCTAALSSTASLAARSRAAATPKCTTSGLVIWLNTVGNGAAGSIFYKLYLTNLSGRSCTLRGFPGVSAVNLAGHSLGRSAARESFQKPTTVTVGRGATAQAVLRIANPGNFPASACREVIAAGLRVRPPGRVSSKVVPFPFNTCSGSGVGNLSVRAVTPKE
jgi:hypothetical protein